MNEFEEFGIREEVIRAITELGFETPTPIQKESIPVLMSGNTDLIGLAQTGTGKTAAFGLPLLHLLDFNNRITQALILAPTRELCVQIAGDLDRYATYMTGVRIVAIYGGASIQNQISEIKKGVHIIVATPGRLIDLIGRKRVNISTVRYVVLDEADEMLNMGFKDDIDKILENTPTAKRTWLFAATMPDEMRSITRNYMHNPHELTVGKKNTTADNIEHIYYVVHERDRYPALKRMVDANPDIFAIVFCRTKVETQEIAEKLIRDGYNADSLHGDLSQPQRDKVMKRYRERALQLLIATDVAARGIDVNDVSHVINYNLPDEVENYTHRSGRTARAGKSGITLSIINSREIDKIRQIEKLLHRKFTYARVPDGIEICEQQFIGLMKKLRAVEVNEQAIEKFLPSIYDELAGIDKEELIKRMVSIEFNRFLDYYRNATDLSVDMARKDHVKSNDSYKTGSSMFINLGTMDGFDSGSMQRYMMETTGMPSETFGKMNIKGVYSFIDVEENAMNNVLQSFRNEVYKGRKVRVDASRQGGGKKISSPDRKSNFEKNRSRPDRSRTERDKPDRSRPGQGRFGNKRRRIVR